MVGDTYPFPRCEMAAMFLRCSPSLKHKNENRTYGDAAGRGLRGSVACIAGARHTTLSPLLTSLGTFLFSDKGVPPLVLSAPSTR